jgi:uncharacterized cofD-like protein
MMTKILNPKPQPKIVVIGGGTGSFTILNNLKRHTPNLVALVNMVDDGGSTGELRDELGVLPPGDVRQCLVALSPSESMRDIFSYRFPKGSMWSGHSLGNILLSGIESMTGDFAGAIEVASDILRITGRVVPVTLDNCRLVVKTTDGQVIKGEHATETADIPSLKGSTISFNNPAKLNPEAIKAIESADMIVIAPGDLYTSIAPTLVVSDLGKAIRKSKAKLVLICNLVNKERHTVGFEVQDYADEVERYIGGESIDYVVYNTEEPDVPLLKKYIKDREYPVKFDSSVLSGSHYKAIGGHFLSHTKTERNKNDSIPDRSLIRHDSNKVALALMDIYTGLV